ncbi:MAG: RNA-binding S4 domain-containing protein [Pseudomonadota bacterium]
MSEARLRVDKWLWYGRFFKTRSLASKACAGGQLRLNGTAVAKPHTQVKVGDVLTFAQGHHIRVIKVAALGVRRGPAPEAQALYEDLKPPSAENRLPGPKRSPGSGRPTKKERREMERLKDGGSG